MRFLKMSAGGAMLAGILLVCMIFVPRSYTREALMALGSGSLIAAPEDISLYARQLSLMFTLVCVYLPGHFLMWAGYGRTIGKKAPFLGSMVTIIGFFCCATDFCEYALRGAVIQAVQLNAGLNTALPVLWWSIRGASIWLIYLGAAMTAIALPSAFRFRRQVIFTAVLGMMTIPCLYLFNASKIWFCWLIAWHFVSALSIWQSAEVHTQTDDHSPTKTLERNW